MLRSSQVQTDSTWRILPPIAVKGKHVLVDRQQQHDKKDCELRLGKVNL
jgi:hypothetical protein